mmetsp:Transcript_20361/g.60236  ORF Transcript_20361/g.60236 Transcript_20361/m.60236 type:complete len:255 (-) Transcript_20361:16-780(-)
MLSTCIWKGASSPADRTASACAYLLRLRPDLSVPLPGSCSASASASPRDTPVSHPTIHATTLAPIARTAAAVLATSPTSWERTPAWLMPIPCATKPLSSSGIDSDHTQITCRPMRWTAWCATTAPVETGSTTTTASAPGTDKPASAALATSSALARLTVGTSSYVCAVGREEETARGRPPFSHSRYSVSMPMRHAVRSNLSSAESGQLSYQATRRSGALPHLSCIHLRCGPLFTTGVGDSFTFRMSWRGMIEGA